MKQLLEFLVKSLVVNEDAVAINESEENGEVHFTVFVDEKDLGRVIGKGGQVASSIRTIIKSISSRQHKKVFVKFEENKWLRLHKS